MRPSPRSRPELWICRLGTVPYEEGLALQRALRGRLQAGEVPDVLLLLEHPPTYTRGRRSADGELPFGEQFYSAQRIEIVATDRGGRVTYHGPGQLVGYPIMQVADVVAHVRLLETAIVAALAEEGIAASSRATEGPDFTGVWVEDRKIASIGVHYSGGVTTHGFAVNVVNDLEPFSWIVPCGLAGVRMTSVQMELGRSSEQRPSAERPHDERAREGRPSERSLVELMARRVSAHLCELSGRRASQVAPAEILAGAPTAKPAQGAGRVLAGAA